MAQCECNAWWDILAGLWLGVSDHHSTAGRISKCSCTNFIVWLYSSWTYRCNGRVQLTDVHAAGRVLTVVRVVGDHAVFTRLHGRLGGVRVQVDELLPWQGGGTNRQHERKQNTARKSAENNVTSTKRTDVTDEVVGAVGFPPNDAQRLGQHEAVL